MRVAAFKCHQRAEESWLPPPPDLINKQQTMRNIQAFHAGRGVVELERITTVRCDAQLRVERFLCEGRIIKSRPSCRVYNSLLKSRKDTLLTLFDRSSYRKE